MREITKRLQRIFHLAQLFAPGGGIKTDNCAPVRRAKGNADIFSNGA
jgi:hypothetical protein